MCIIDKWRTNSQCMQTCGKCCLCPAHVSTAHAAAGRPGARPLFCSEHNEHKAHLVRVVELVIHEPGDDAGLANRLITQEDLQHEAQRCMSDTPAPQGRQASSRQPQRPPLTTHQLVFGKGCVCHGCFAASVLASPLGQLWRAKKGSLQVSKLQQLPNQTPSAAWANKRSRHKALLSYGQTSGERQMCRMEPLNTVVGTFSTHETNETLLLCQTFDQRASQ